MFGGLGPLEIIVLLVIFFVLFGAERLPKMANALGRSKGEFHKGLEQSTNAVKLEQTIKDMDAGGRTPSQALAVVKLVLTQRNEPRRIGKESRCLGKARC